jgi:hypothetical protein
MAGRWQARGSAARAAEDRSMHDVTAARPGFAAFYRDHYLAEHSAPGNVALHVIGTLAGLAWLPASLLSPWPWLVLLFPAVHAAPGLLGHRLFERNATVGDLRVTRRDFPPHWFIAANHRLVWDLLLGRVRRTGERRG